MIYDLENRMYFDLLSQTGDCRIIRKIESGDGKISTLSGMNLQNITLSEARGIIVNLYHER